jgi:RNA polymerase sigma-70 factor (ECF subfamily)
MHGTRDLAGPTMVLASGDEYGKAQRFRTAALPHIDDIYTLARYLLRNAADAEDAVQECYLRAFRHFDTFRGSTIRPWLMAILRNVCRAQYAKRAGTVPLDAETVDEDAAPLWNATQDSPETEALRTLEAQTLQRLVEELPEPFREMIVLREINDLSYREIAEALAVPLGTVMSRLARARALLRSAWIAEEGRLS